MNSTNPIDPKDSEKDVPEFNQYCLQGLHAIECIMAEMSKKGTDIHQLMSFIGVVWASHAANIMRNYMPDMPINDFKMGAMAIAGDCLDRMLEPMNIPPKKDMQ